MKILALLVTLLFMGGCPYNGGEGEEMEVETRITRSNFRNDVNKMEVAYDSNFNDATFQCQVKLTGVGNGRVDQNWQTCASNPLLIPMQIGERLELRVRAIAEGNRPDLSPETFTFVRLNNNNSGNPVAIQPPTFQVGIAYEFQVPEGMHITQYASNNNYHGAGIELVRLQQGQGYDYLGSYPLSKVNNDGCSIFAQGIVSLKSGSGSHYSYCHSYLDSSSFFGMFNRNYARNHVEVASDNHFGSGQGGRPHARLLVQTYGPQEESMLRNRFNDLCHPSRVVKPVSRFHGVPMAQGFWFADEMRVRDTYVCTVKLGGMSGGYYQVGGFTAVTRINDSHHTIGCSEGSCGSYGKFISVVYMERVAGENGIDHNFARNFQHTLLNSLRRNRP